MRDVGDPDRKMRKWRKMDEVYLYVRRRKKQTTLSMFEADMSCCNFHGGQEPYRSPPMKQHPRLLYDQLLSSSVVFPIQLVNA